MEENKHFTMIGLIAGCVRVSVVLTVRVVLAPVKLETQ